MQSVEFYVVIAEPRPVEGAFGGGRMEEAGRREGGRGEEGGYCQCDLDESSEGIPARGEDKRWVVLQVYRFP